MRYHVLVDGAVFAPRTGPYYTYLEAALRRGRSLANKYDESPVHVEEHDGHGGVRRWAFDADLNAVEVD